MLKENSKELSGLFVVLVCATVLRLFGLGDHSLWLDEALTIQLSSLPMSTLWITAFDPNPPTFYTVEKFILLFGDSEFLLRLPSAIYNIVTVLFVFKATRLVGNLNGAIFAGLAIALSTSNIQYAQEARAYSLVGMMISISFYGAVLLACNAEVLKQSSGLRVFLKNGGAYYSLGSLGALYSHNLGVFFVFGAQVFIFSQFWLDREFFKSVLKNWFLMNLLVFILWVPWIVASVEAAGRNFNWLRHYGPIEAIAILKNAHAFNSTYFARPFYWLATDAVIAAAILGGLLRLRSRTKLFVLLLSLLASSTFVIWVFGYLKPVFMDKTVLWGTVFSAFLMGVLVSTVSIRVARVVTAFLIVLGGLDYYDYTRLEISTKQDWQSSVGYINEKVAPGSPIILCPNYSDASVAYYLGPHLVNNSTFIGWDRPTGYYNIGRLSQRAGYHPTNNWSESVPDLSSIANLSTAWVVTSHCSVEEYSALATDLTGLGFSEVEVHEGKGMAVHKFTK